MGQMGLTRVTAGGNSLSLRIHGESTEFFIFCSLDNILDFLPSDPSRFDLGARGLWSATALRLDFG